MSKDPAKQTSTITLPARSWLRLQGIPVQLVTAAEARVAAGDWERIIDRYKERMAISAPVPSVLSRIIAALRPKPVTAAHLLLADTRVTLQGVSLRLMAPTEIEVVAGDWARIMDLIYAEVEAKALAWDYINSRSDDAHDYGRKYLMPQAWGQNVWHAILDDAIRMRADEATDPQASKG